MGSGGHVFFAKYTLNLPYIIYPIFSSQKIIFSYIIFVKDGLTLYYCHQFVTFHRSYVIFSHFVFILKHYSMK